MAITDPLVLPKDILLTPVTDIPAEARQKLEFEPGDYALRRPRSRTLTKIIDADAAALLEFFKAPLTIPQAILQYSRDNQLPPETTLEEALPFLEGLIGAQLLVTEDSEIAKSIEPTFSVGEQVQDWKILRCLQVLEDTEIYQVQTKTGQTAALKIMRPAVASTLQVMFQNEAAILRHLNGSISPELFDEGTLDERPYLLMEWCEGREVAIAAADLRQAQDWQALFQLCRSILQAYADLHKQQVIHADIHPRNALVAADGSVKLIDFGLARRTDIPYSSQPPVQRGGVGYFFEPEYAQAYCTPAKAHQSPPPATSAGEQYAVAALIYCLLTGTHYLDFSPEKSEMFRQIAEEQPQFHWPMGMQYGPAIEVLLEKALSKVPSQRFDTMTTFAEQWSTIELESTTHQLTLSTQPFLEDVLERLQIDQPLFQDGFPQAPKASVNYGAAGIAYALYRISGAQDKPALLSLADIWVQKAIEHVDDPEAFYNPAFDLLPSTVGRVSPYHTASGIFAVQALIANAMGDGFTQSKAIQSFVQHSQATCENLDLTLGQTSTLLGCSLLLDTLPAPQPVSKSNSVEPSQAWQFVRDELVELGDRIDQKLREQLEAWPAIADCKELPTLGIAHGWAGLLYGIMRWCEAAGRSLPTWLESRLQQLADCAETFGQGVRWPWQQRVLHQPEQYMPGWCNGSAGYVYLWTLAAQLLQKDAYLVLAEKAAWSTYEQPSRLGNLCCGLAGQAYGLLNLYQATGQKEWLAKTQELAERAVSQGQIRLLQGSNLSQAYGLLPDSLYKGDVGLAVLVADLARPAFAAMPFFEREFRSLQQGQ